MNEDITRLVACQWFSLLPLAGNPPVKPLFRSTHMESRKMTLTALGLLSTIALTAVCSDDRAQQPPTVVTTTQPTPPPATTYVAPSTNPPPLAGQVNPSTVPTTNNTNAGPGGPTGSELGDKITREIHT